MRISDLRMCSSDEISKMMSFTVPQVAVCSYVHILSTTSTIISSWSFVVPNTSTVFIYCFIWPTNSSIINTGHNSSCLGELTLDFHFVNTDTIDTIIHMDVKQPKLDGCMHFALEARIHTYL